MLSYVCSGLLLGFSMLMDKWLNFIIALSMMIYRAKMEKSPLSLRGQILLADRPGCTQHVWMHCAEVYWMRICIICRVCIRHCSVNNIFLDTVLRTIADSKAQSRNIRHFGKSIFSWLHHGRLVHCRDSLSAPLAGFPVLCHTFLYRAWVKQGS